METEISNLNAVYELPVNFSVTRASVSDVLEVNNLAKQQLEIMNDCEFFTGDISQFIIRAYCSILPEYAGQDCAF